MPTLIQSRSSMFKSYSYNEADRILTVVFGNGGTYDYFKVPPETFNEMKDAESEGKFFLSRIKPTYECEKQA